MTLEDYDVVVSPITGNKIDMKQLLRDQRIAYAGITTNFPFFETLLRNLKWCYVWTVNTQATDGTRILVNPEFTASLSLNMKAFVMIHEAMHCALCHMARAKKRGDDHFRSNVAGDYEINGQLVDCGIWKGNDIKDFLYDPKFSGQAYEHIYAQVSGGKGKQNQETSDQEGSGSSDQQSQGSGSGGNGGQDNTPKSPEWVDGWNKAIEDYKAGKIKL